MQSYQVIVIGAGVAGSAAALALAGRGSVLLLEQHDFGHALGSSHGGSRIFRHAYEDVRYVRLAVEADGLWQRLERDADERLLYRSGGIDIGAAGSPALSAIENALAAAGRPFERLTAEAVRRRFPAFRLAEGEEAVFSADAGVLAADRCLATMQRMAHLRGATLRAHTPVAAIRTTAHGVEVRTAGGERFGAETIILTAGPWLSEGPLALPLPLQIEQQQVIYLQVGRAERFERGRCPVFIHYGSFIYGFPLFERPDAVKLSDHSGAPAIRLGERATEPNGARAAATAERARALLPDLGERVASDLCLYTKTPDEHFVLGAHPEFADVIVGGGFSGHGFKFGPLLGEILAELALDGTSGRDLSLFDPGRFG